MKVKFQGSKSISSHSKQSNNSTSPSSPLPSSQSSTAAQPPPPSPPGDHNNMDNNHKTTTTTEVASSSSASTALEEFSIDWIYPRLKRPSAFWHFASVMTIAVVGIFSKLILGKFSGFSCLCSLLLFLLLFVLLCCFSGLPFDDNVVCGLFTFLSEKFSRVITSKTKIFF